MAREDGLISPAEHDARRPKCMFEHLECSTCDGTGIVAGKDCVDCRSYGSRLCVACEQHTDELLRIQNSFSTVEDRQAWNREWLTLGLPPAAQAAIRSLGREPRRGGSHVS